MDEHKRLHLDRPVEITMPTIFEPTWRSRDFGESMDHLFMMDGFMTLGESRKEGDHSQAGYWGVGSKSPLAYTDQFTVRCIQDRHFRLYLVKFKTFDYADGSYDTRPVIAFIEQGITAEPDGTEVSWAAATKDVSRFERSVTETLAGMFDCTLPTVIANGSPTERFNPTAEVLQHGPDWRLLEAGVTVTRAHARISNILYPLDGYALPGIKDAVRNILEVPLIIDFGTADLHIQPSRDGLEYSDKTVTAVEAKLTTICDELVSEIQAEISACASRWDAIRLFQDRLRGQTKVMATLYTTAIKYQDRALPKGQVVMPKWLTEEDHQVQVRFTTVEAIRSGMLPRAMSEGQLLRNRPLVDPHGDFLICVQHADDRKLKYSAERLLNDLASRPGSTQVLWIRGTQSDPDLQRLLDHYGLPADRVRLINSLPLPPGFVAQKSTSGGGGRAGPSIVRGLQRMHRRTQAVKLPIAGPSEIVYLAIGDDAKLWARIGTRSLDTWEIDRLIAAYRRFSSDERDVVLLRPKELLKVQGKLGWFEISDLMRAWLKANVPDQALLQHSAAYSFVQSDRVARFLLRNEPFFAPYPKVNDAIQLCRSIAKPADDAERTKDGAKVFSEFVGLVTTMASAPATATIVDRIEAFKSAYPVLAYVAEHGSSWGPMNHTEQVVLHHYLALA